MKDKNRGRATRFRGVKALGNGKYRLRIYVTDPKSGRQVQTVKTVTASSAHEAFRLKEELELSVRKEATNEERQADLRGSKRFGEIVDRWWSEISTRKLEEDPSQPYLCPSAYSGASRSPIPTQADHLFRRMPITDSGASRSLNV